MSANWTEAQKSAIEASGRAILVSAAAGSGKTAVLVEKLRRLLTDEKNKTPADRIIVVTFTNDAAAQMKQRLTKALGEELEKNPESSWIASQLSLIPTAKISTIHSFCFNLIRENAGLIGVNSDFSVLSPDDEEVIVAKAAAQVTEEYFSSKRQDMRRLTSFFCPGESSEKRFIGIIPMLRSKILTQPFPEDYMREKADFYKNPPARENDILINTFAHAAAKKMTHAAHLMEKVWSNLVPGSDMEILAREEYSRVLAASADINKDRRFIFEMPPQLKFKVVKTIPAASVPKGSDGKTDKDLQTALKKLREEAIDICRKFCTVTIADGEKEETTPPEYFFSYENIAKDYAVHGEICEKLFALISDVLREERRIKDEKNALGFNDAEQLACSLLCEKQEDGSIVKTPLAKALSEQYEIVMIDEFQDSTAVQEMIFRMLSKNGSAQKPGTNFFAVGDIKQSIYRFRSADPRIFAADIDAAVPYENDGSSEPAYILLSKNFRSSKHVVDFVNTVFDEIMTKETGGVDYGERDRLVQGAVMEKDFGPSEFIDIGAPPKNSSGRTAPSDYYRHEALITAHRIKQLLESETITENGETRPLQPSDFCILSRSSKHFDMYMDAIKKLGIPVTGQTDESFLGSPEIITMVNMLRITDNPTLDIPMTAVLMSPMFMFTAEDMGRIRAAGMSSVYGGICALVQLYRSGEDMDRELFGESFLIKCCDFLDTFGKLRAHAASHSIEEYIRFIYDVTDHIAVSSILEGGDRRKANLRKLPEIAASYDKNSTGGLSGFVRNLNGMIESGRDIEGVSSSSPSANAVVVKTIHGSKGLEYPFVFLCGTWMEFHSEDSKRGFKTVNDRISFYPDTGPVFYINYKESETGEYTGYESFPRRAVGMVLDRAFTDEEMMILYVALTRAKHKLFITRRTDPSAAANRRCAELLREDGKQTDGALWSFSFADWINCVYTEGRINALVKEGRLSRVEGSDIIPKEETAKEAEEIRGSFSEDIAREFERLLSAKPDLTLSKTAAKLTVSELAKAHKDAPRIFSAEEKPQKAPSGISAAERGTAVHAFMQYADFSALYAAKGSSLYECIAKEAERMYSLGLISENQMKCADPHVIGRFVESSLFDRLISSREIIRERKFLVRISDLHLDDEDLLVYNGTEGMLQGVADCIFEEDGGYVILDYKTDRNVTPEILADRYSKQLRLYAAAFSEILDAPVKRACIYSFSLSREIEIKL